MQKVKNSIVAGLAMTLANIAMTDDYQLTVSRLDALKSQNEIKKEQSKGVQLDLQMEDLLQKRRELKKKAIEDDSQDYGGGSVVCYQNVHGSNNQFFADVLIGNTKFRSVAPGTRLTSSLTVKDVAFDGVNGRVTYKLNNKTSLQAPACGPMDLADSNERSNTAGKHSYAQPLQ